MCPQTSFTALHESYLHPRSGQDSEGLTCVQCNSGFSLIVGDDVLIDGEIFLLTDFVNLKIKLVQFFGGAYRCMVYVRVLIEMSIYTYINIYIYTMFFKKKNYSYLNERVLMNHYRA
jgi:hypothetical protein